jgi:hypothetical protein
VVRHTEERKDQGAIFLPTEAIALDMDPFLHCVIPNFIQSQDFLEGLHKELLSLDFHEKYNDLYKFQQVIYSHCIHWLFLPRNPLAIKSSTNHGYRDSLVVKSTYRSSRSSSQVPTSTSGEFMNP